MSQQKDQADGKQRIPLKRLCSERKGEPMNSEDAASRFKGLLNVEVKAPPVIAGSECYYKPPNKEPISRAHMYRIHTGTHIVILNEANTRKAGRHYH